MFNIIVLLICTYDCFKFNVLAHESEKHICLLYILKLLQKNIYKVVIPVDDDISGSHMTYKMPVLWHSAVTMCHIL